MVDANPPQRPPMGWKQSLVYALLPVILAFAVLEAAARIVEIWRPPITVDLGQGFGPESRLFVPKQGHPATMVTHPDKTLAFRNQAFERRKPQGTMRVVALGGSSVNYLDYEFSVLKERLEAALAPRFTNVEIINCGGLSYGSHRLVILAAEVIAYEPDLVLIYSGHNEFEEIQQLELADLRAVPIQRALSHSALFRFIRDQFADRRIAELEEDRDQRNLATSVPDASKAWMYRFSEEEITERMTAFRTNLGRIIELCREHHVPVIIGTVPSNLIKPSLPGKDGHRYQKAEDLFGRGEFERGLAIAREVLRTSSPRHQSSDEENAVIRAVASEYGVPLADVEAAVVEAEPHHVPGETLFSDHCHLNPAGNEILRRVYEAEILRLFRE